MNESLWSNIHFLETQFPMLSVSPSLASKTHRYFIILWSPWKKQAAQPDRRPENTGLSTIRKCHNWKHGQVAMTKETQNRKMVQRLQWQICQTCSRGIFPLIFCSFPSIWRVKHKVLWAVHGNFSSSFDFIPLLEQTLFWNMTIPSDLFSLVFHYEVHFQDNRMPLF